MKPSLKYGLYWAFAGIVLTLLMYFSGFHESAEKLKVAGWVEGSIGFIIAITCLALAMREARAQASLENDWTYGSAFGTGAATSTVAVLIGAAWRYVYTAFINTQLPEITVQAQLAGMEARGVPAARLEAAESMMRKMQSPAVSACMAAVFGMIVMLVITLIVAIFFRKREAQPIEGLPPTMG